MENFTFSTPTEIFFGKSQINGIGEQIVKHGGTHVLICYGSNRIKESKLLDTIIKLLKKSNIAFSELCGILPNPRIASVREGIEICRKDKVDFILAVGGGSVIDCAKTIAAGVYYDKDPWDFFIEEAEITDALPLATVLTLAATGSEMNGNTVITDREALDKRSTGSPLLRPRFSILDPVYTYSVPQQYTAAGVVDIMSHVFEQYFSSAQDTYLQSRLAEAILSTALHFGPIALEKPKDYEARANLLWASTLALNDLLSFGQPGDWACHAIEHAISGVSDIPHGVGLAIVTPAWMDYVLEGSNKLKFYSLSVNLYGARSGKNDTLTAKSAIVSTQEFFTSIGMPQKLSEVGITKDQLEDIAQKTVRFGPVGTLKELKYDDVHAILEKCL